MSWSNNALALVSDPCHYGNLKRFAWPAGHAPTYEWLSTEQKKDELLHLDRSRRVFSYGTPLPSMRVLTLGWLERTDLLDWRIWKQAGHFAALFPNYNANTRILHHFETDTPEILDADASWTKSGVFTSAAGRCGGGMLPGALAFYDVTLTEDASDMGSCALWFRAADSTLLNKGFWRVAGDTTEMAVRWNSETGEFALRCGNSATSVGFGPATVSAGEWHHIAWTWDLAAGDLTTYWDGCVADSTTGALAFPSAGQLTALMEVGRALNVTLDSSDWVLDEFRYDVGSWTAAEVAAQYDRLTEPDERLLAEQVQGVYFDLQANEVHALSAEEQARGRLLVTLRGAWSDANQTLARESE